MAWVVAGRLGSRAKLPTKLKLAGNLACLAWRHASRNRLLVANVLSPTIPRRHSSPNFTRPDPQNSSRTKHLRLRCKTGTCRDGPTRFGGDSCINALLSGPLPAAVVETAGHRPECKHRGAHSDDRSFREFCWHLTRIPNVRIFCARGLSDRGNQDL